MKLSVRRIVLLVLSIVIIGFGLYSIIDTFVQIPTLHEQFLEIVKQSLGDLIPDVERAVNVAIVISVVVSCSAVSLIFLPGIFGLVASLGKYKGGVHVVLAWIYFALCAIGLLINIVALIKGAQFDYAVIINGLEFAVIIAFIVISKQVKAEDY